jgi:adenosylcobinamide-GDP ribazoletransferase
MSWSSAWRLAVGTLTVIPVRPPAVVDRTVAGRAMLLAPVAVLPLAVAAAALGWSARLTEWPAPLSGVVVVGALALGTRALHLDGLADTVDGLGSGAERVRALEIMRRGDIGPMGVVALILVLLAQALAASSLTASWTGALLLVACCAGVPAARPGGLGSAVAGTVSARVALLAGLGSALVVVAATALLGRPWWCGVIAAAGGALVAHGLVRLAVGRLGGITGDVLGATVELTLTALLLSVTLA